MASRRLAAVDLGAGSGRVAVGAFDGDAVALEIVHRFVSHPLWLPDGLHWNLLQLFADILDGLALATRMEPLQGIGIDGWGCDYALLDGEHRVLGLPYHYRDPARACAEVVSRAHARVDRHELYARTGIQTMPINTVFQLVAEAERPLVRAAEHIALIPDLIGLWLTGSLANEVTAASTTGLLEARGMRWAHDLVERLGLPARPFARDVVAPGTELGGLLSGHTPAERAIGTVVRTVAGHDTACAFAATPLRSAEAAVLSSGTWSLLGLELPSPELGSEAEAFNLTNERGIGNTTRLLRNVMGMWLVEECRREWGDAGTAPSYGELLRAAAAVTTEVALFDPDDPSLLHPGPMAERIAELCRSGRQPIPSGRGELVRSILVSLACKYRLVLERLEQVSGRRIELVNVVGGGSRNGLLCRLTAEVTGREVIAGPAEATVLGNVLVQLMATGDIRSLEEMRELAARSVSLERYAPEQPEHGLEIYQRFLDATGLAAAPARTAV
jgi:rhamnulokinase